MTFKEYLLSKKINAEKFEQNDADIFRDWEKIFENMHVESFTMQKKFLINDMRRTYPLNQI